MEDDLNRPLSVKVRRRRQPFGICTEKIVAAMAISIFGGFVLWAIIGNPQSNKPEKALKIVRPSPETKSSPYSIAFPPQPNDNLAKKAGPVPKPVPNRTINTKTVTIIDGKTGAREEVIIPATSD
jgi:hypothetical protein